MSADELESLFRLYGRHVLRRANAILGDGDAAKDVAQEVFARALRARASLPNAAASVGWLYRITTNLCLSGMRDRNRRRQILDRWAPRAANPTFTPATDEALTVRALLRDVPIELQEIAVHYFVDDMSQAEIAELTGIPRRTVGYRLEQFRTRVQAVEAAPALVVDVAEPQVGRA
jgi:RNA polymerase sigma factor (sigma-70 family)